jgi:hypothetical protein
MLFKDDNHFCIFYSSEKRDRELFWELSRDFLSATSFFVEAIFCAFVTKNVSFLKMASLAS